MKNRLQIRYHIPNKLPTRDEALNYISETFAMQENGNTSLIAEPLVILYNNNTSLSQKEALNTSNAILAIGRGGDGKDIFKNKEYFVIDFAKHTEDIGTLFKNIEQINNQFVDIDAVFEEINNFIKTVGEKGDGCEKNTLYGYIDCIAETVEDEVLRAQNAEANIIHLLNDETDRRIVEDNFLKDEIKQNKVKSENNTILVSNANENGTNIEVNVDNRTIVSTNGMLSVAPEALVQYKGENSIKVSETLGDTKTISLEVHPEDKIISNTTQGLYASLSLKWVHANVDGVKDEIQLIGKNDEILSRIDVADFIKDGMVNNVFLDTSDANNPKLVIIFNSVSGKETINIPVKDLIRLYLPGNGLTLENNTFHVNVDPESQKYITIGTDGIKIIGVDEELDRLSRGISYAQSHLENLVTTERNRAESKENEINTKNEYNTNSLNKLIADTTQEGSIKKIIFDSVIGPIITDVDVANANEQSLLKKLIIDGQPYFYASNNTTDIKHDGDSLNNIIKKLQTQIDIIPELQNTIHNLQTELFNTKNELLETKTKLDNLQKQAITNIIGNDKEISVSVTDNTATVGFASDAYFIAG